MTNYLVYQLVSPKQRETSSLCHCDTGAHGVVCSREETIKPKFHHAISSPDKGELLKKDGKKVKKGIPFRNIIGRPPKFSSECYEDVRAVVAIQQVNQSITDHNTALLKIAQKINEPFGKLIKAIDAKTIRNLENLLKVKTGEAEVMTDFRFSAMSVQRNAVCDAVYAETTYLGLFCQHGCNSV